MGSGGWRPLLDDLSYLRVIDEDDDDPFLIGRDGRPIETWREHYPSELDGPGRI